MKERYRFGFEISALILFFIIMIPNIIWAKVPAPDDILRIESITPALDIVATICQVVMIILLCAIVNKDSRKLGVSKWIVTCLVCCALYFTSWVFYYMGTTNVVIILGLTIPPCLAFFFFAIDRKNMIAMVPNIIFMVCHLVYAVVNFII